MPMPRKPVELHELSGTFRRDRHGQRRHAPKSPHPISDPLACLGPDEAACWREFVVNMPANVLTSADRMALECLSRLIAKSRREYAIAFDLEMASLESLLPYRAPHWCVLGMRGWWRCGEGRDSLGTMLPR